MTLEGRFGSENLLRTVFTTSLAGFDSAGQFFPTTGFNHYVLPSLVKHFLDLLWYVDDMSSGYYIIVAMNVTIIQLFVPEAIFLLPELVKFFYFALVLNLARPPQRRQWAHVGVHRSEDLASIIHFATNVLRSIIPVESQSINRLSVVIVHVKEFHDAAEVIRFAWRLTDKIHVIWVQSVLMNPKK